jgi:hypothetical protein
VEMEQRVDGYNAGMAAVIGQGELLGKTLHFSGDGLQSSLYDMEGKEDLLLPCNYWMSHGE